MFTHPVQQGNDDRCWQVTRVAVAGALNSVGSRCLPHAMQWMCCPCWAAGAAGRFGLRAFRSRLVSCLARFIVPSGR